MTTKYDNLTKDELIALLKTRDERRFGLIWERNEIEHEKSLNEDFVVLDFDPALSVGEPPFRNLLIEGDNFDALRYLRMTLAGRVKCICIDPPYNTGNKDFIYNDSFVDKDDRYRHSKWLEYMYQRLSLARDLLTEDGVIFVNIGEDELGRLSCLMDQVFPGMKVCTFVWRRRSGSNDAKEFFISVDHEYVLCYANKAFSFGGDTKTMDAYSNPDSDPRGPWINGPLNQGKDAKQRKESYYPIQNPETGVWYPCDPKSVWRFASEKKLKPGKKIRTKTMEQIIREKKVIWPPHETPVTYHSLEELIAALDAGEAPTTLDRNSPDLEFWIGRPIGFGKPRYKRHFGELKRLEKPLSTWILPASMKKEDVEALDLNEVETITTGFTVEGTSLLQQMLGNKDFSYPKPLSLIQSLVKQSTGSDDIIVDFFAGSGTTGHAVLAQNTEDGDNRRFILVSSTESTEKEPNKNVCREITQKRLAKAIGGYSYQTKKGRKEVDGLGGDFAYLVSSRIPTGKILKRINHKQIWLALQLIHHESISPFSQEDLLKAEENGLQLIYVTRFNEMIKAQIGELVSKSREVVIYSWQPELLQQYIFHPSVSIRPVPQSLMDRYGVRK
jgi:adenine-specific DNA-methyltransferase